MKLYYSPGACSQAAHIVLHETGFSHDSIRVDLKAKSLEDGSDYRRINPKGAVPALELENGEVLTENAVILQYLGDRSGSPDLLPPLGDFRRYRVLEWLNFVATELHKGFSPLFNPAAASEWKQAARDQLGKKFDYVDQQLGDGPFLTGNRFTIADAYLFVMLGWTAVTDIDLGRWPGLTAFRERAAQRPSARQVLEFEGLVETETAS
ncbi:MAG TPA: glutathione transferase GstA [Sphingomicrobium sp.]|jgi:glutathione S-transferase|nr:glutathione transferase GstA [Sphingomicrobium sp.]